MEFKGIDTDDKLVNHPNHYLSNGLEVIDILKAFTEDLTGIEAICTGNILKLNRDFISNINAPVCIAGSINGYDKLDELKNINPWAFTIGSAFFENKFDGTFEEQINHVYEHVKK